MTAPCAWCGQTLTFGAQGWVHANGHLYVGACHCDQTAPHNYSHDDTGRVICPTWRDHHAAMPDRRAEV